MEHYWVVLCGCTHTQHSFSLFSFPAGFTQGHDTFLKGFGSPGLIIPSIIQWLAGRWSEAMNKANLWAYELWQYKHTILALVSSVHAWNYTAASRRNGNEGSWLQGLPGQSSPTHYTHTQAQTTRLGEGQNAALNPSPAYCCSTGQLWGSFFHFLRGSFVKPCELFLVHAHWNSVELTCIRL